jgi:7,8-didemethyl-8-hydroxy-5-deazariboflavin synthase CofH subunit
MPQLCDDLDVVRSYVNGDDPLEKVLGRAKPAIARVLGRALDGRPVSVEDGVQLLACESDDLRALIRTADEIRRRDVGPEVTYVVNRNVNFTNVCFVGCQFCAFKRQRWESDAYNHSLEEILDRVQQAVDRGATEICMQGGINPDMEPFAYRDLLGAIKKQFPDIHVHAFSPMEIMYGARRAGMSYVDYLTMLRDAGIGSLPGTAAEILDDEVRDLLSHKKVTVSTWVEIITTAHRLGIPTTSTIMYGHVETPTHIAKHIDLLRAIQADTGGFTEFVPLRFIYLNTMLYQKGLVQPTPTGLIDMRMYAVSRCMLRGAIANLQTSWVKLGHPMAQLSLLAGCNDFGGTLMEESISREAGADAGEYTSAAEMESLIREIGRVPVERTTLYGRPVREAHDGEAGCATDRGPGWWRGGGAVPGRAHAGH